MKLLTVLRHAKSSWKDESLEDHDRPLARRGKRDAPRMGELIKDKGLVPEAIVSSTARRARDTALAVASSAGFPDEVRFTRRLYGATPGDCLAVLAELPESAAHAMIVGHNPTFEELLALLVGESHPMPTATLAVVELPINSWRDLDPLPRGSLRALWRPRDLGG